MSDFMKPCGICGEICNHRGARGNVVVCPKCTDRATTLDGRPVTFYESIEKREDGVLMFMGPDVYYKAPDPEAGSSVPGFWTDGLWIDGKRVELYEGVAGWLGLIVR